ncbi:MAG: hypothetical protein HRU19_27685 [Pseudobacteriovorax sp.]|nr:hypothetical protein [Pseudobacteriovorax sp.]
MKKLLSGITMLLLSSSIFAGQTTVMSRAQVMQRLMSFENVAKLNFEQILNNPSYAISEEEREVLREAMWDGDVVYSEHLESFVSPINNEVPEIVTSIDESGRVINFIQNPLLD